MTIRAGFFNSINQDRLYNAADLNMPYKYLISNGVIPVPSSSLQVMAGGGLTVTVQAGAGLFGGGWAYNDAPEALAIDAAHSTLNRIDLVVIRRDDNENVRDTGLFVIKGTPASNPVAPSIERSTYVNEYALAEIYVPKQATAITQSNITDTRPDTDRCGWTTGLINQVDTSTLFLQWQAAYEEQYEVFQNEFSTWWAEIRNILADDESAAAQILLLQQEKADKKALTASLLSIWWSKSGSYYYQTFSDESIGANDIIIVSPIPGHTDIWGENGVVCTEQADGSLTFISKAAVDVKANILNLGSAVN